MCESLDFVSAHSPSMSKMWCRLKVLSSRIARTRQGRCPLECRAIPPTWERAMAPISILPSIRCRSPWESLEAAISLLSSLSFSSICAW